MATFELNPDEIFRKNLMHLGNEAKRRLIELLASSLTFSNTQDSISATKAKRKALLDKANGAWCNDGLSVEEEIEQIRKARTQGRTRKIVDL
jgi:hypothetical protein